MGDNLSAHLMALLQGSGGAGALPGAQTPEGGPDAAAGTLAPQVPSPVLPMAGTPGNPEMPTPATGGEPPVAGPPAAATAPLPGAPGAPMMAALANMGSVGKTPGGMAGTSPLEASKGEFDYGNIMAQAPKMMSRMRPDQGAQ